ncbi:MAG TPA: UDP-N-acetylmuramoyl-tripeptide--D-alanyl-D-alanine ligase [Puia sp.]|nr:UDP-N-acetylmuramoyl-tripeptide--D-alanyl-D-alanine ligase [Puia sp.]
MNIEQLYQLYLRHPSIQTDTRKLKDGDLFFALKGPNFSGNQFALSALEQGAAYAVIDEAPPAPSQPSGSGASEAPHGSTAEASAVPQVPAALSDRLIRVDDVLTTLQALALHHRRQFDIPFIAITGSNGKTTTKELVYAVLASKYSTYTTVGNLNNHIGVPLTLLSVKKDAQFAVIEMGANHQKEIEGYCQYTLPTHGIITNAGKAHLEGFGGPEGVKKGKGELYAFLRQHDGTAFVMWDYDYLREMSKGIPHIVRYGTADADIIGVVEGPDPVAGQTGFTGSAGQTGSFLRVRITGGAGTGVISTQLVGDYNLPNVLVAVAVGKQFGVPDQLIRQSIEAYTPSNSRSQLIERDSNHIILDAYNANPSSMKAAIENFARMNAGGASAHMGPGHAIAGPAAPPKKVLILGAMAELGEESLQEHRQIVELIGKYPWQQVVLVGGDFLRIEHPYLSFNNSREAGGWLQQAGFTDTWLLIKGSRSTKMEEVLG